MYLDLFAICQVTVEAKTNKKLQTHKNFVCPRLAKRFRFFFAWRLEKVIAK